MLLDKHATRAASADMAERMAKLGAEPMLMTPLEFDADIKKQINANAALVKASGIAVN